MSLKFSWDWQGAPEVRSAELAATWANLKIEIDDIVATLVEERDQSHGVRKSIDVSTYPLAEWLAINWWVLNAPAHRPEHRGVKFVEAGSGFPWPDITLQSDRSLMWADIRQRDKDPEFIRFLTQGHTILDAEEGIGEVARFIDLTVRKLEESGISGTLLQQEWTAIQLADREERDFCTVAAAWGFDPYDMPDRATEKLIGAEQVISDPWLLADLARAVDLDAVAGAAEWLLDASHHVTDHASEIPAVQAVFPVESRGIAPWREGYRRARYVRDLLGLAPTERAPIEALVGVSTVSSDPPRSIDGLVTVSDTSAGLVLGPHVGEEVRRFRSARALARRTTESRMGLSLLTRASRYSDRVERAFAAEFLAPAAGLDAVLGGDYSDDAVQDAARTFGVSQRLIEHQIDNQLVA